MDRLLSRLERKLGKLALPHLTLFLVGGMAAVFVLSRVQPEFLGKLTFDLNAIKSGEVWRVFTYLFVPKNETPIWLFFELYFLWMVGTNLENEWGAFKLNAYYFVGIFATTASAVVVGLLVPGAERVVNNEALNYSLFFAFATLFPNFQVLLIVIPIRVKWLALVTAGLLVYRSVEGGWAMAIPSIAAVLNYFLFFTPHLVALARGRALEVKQAARRASMRPSARPSTPPPAPVVTTSHEEPLAAIGFRACAICGAKETDGTDIRVCTCEKCGKKPRNLCLEHARNH